MAVQNIICLFIVLELISSEVVRMCSYVCWLALKRVSVEPKAVTIPKFNSGHLPFTRGYSFGIVRKLYFMHYGRAKLKH